MQRRVKKLLAMILAFVVCVQMMPVQTFAELTVDGDTYVVTADDLTDEYIVKYGGILEFSEGLTVDGNVTFGGGAGTITIPATTTVNGDISGFNSNTFIQNAGNITSRLDLTEGTLENNGSVSELVVSSGGMLRALDGSSFGTLDIASANTGKVTLASLCPVETLYINGNAFSEGDSSAAQFQVNQAVTVTGGDNLDEKFRVNVSDATAITTSAYSSGLSVWKDGIAYFVPPNISGLTINDMYAIDVDKNTLTFEEQAIGYQTSPSGTFTIVNSGIAEAAAVKFVPGGEWDEMFSVTPSDNVVEDVIDGDTYYYIPASEAGVFTVTLNIGLAVGDHSGAITVKCYTPDGDEYKTLNVSSKVTVAKKPSIAVPAGDFYTMSGTKGKNGFYTSDVKVTPLTGYLIAKELENVFSTLLTYTASVASPTVYLQKTETGQITEKASLKEIKIDKAEPQITGCENAKTYYADSMEITVKDDNLSRVTLDGNVISVKNKEATTTLTAGDDTKEYTILAEDLAGNTKKNTFYLSPVWRESGVVPKGKSVKLYKNKKYTLGSGTWSVSGDTTSYTGGNAFYVASDGTYTFGSAD